MKRLIIIKGKGGIGKSSLLLEMIEAIKVDPSFIEVREIKHYNGRDELYIFSKEDSTGAIITIGDPTTGYEVGSYLDECLNFDTHTIIAASRTRGEIYNILNDFALRNNFEIIETSTLYSHNASHKLTTFLNNAQIDLLLNLLNTSKL